MDRPIIGIPMGDPAGIGPEIVLKALRNSKLYDICKPLVVGDLNVLKKIDQVIQLYLCINVTHFTAIDHEQRTFTGVKQPFFCLP